MKYKIKEIGEVITGNTPSKKNIEFYYSNDINFYTPSDFKGNCINEFKESLNFISNKAKEKSRIIPKGSLLVTCIGIIGKVGIISKDSAFNQQINAIIPNEKLVINKYLAYWFISKSDLLQKTANACIVPILNKTNFQELEVNIPDINFQISVVKKLDKIQEIIDIRKKQIDELDELIKSQFVKMFGDKNFEKKKIKEFAEVRTGGTPDRKNELYWKNGNIPWIKTGEVKANIINEAEEYITELGLNNSSAVLFNEGTILIAMYGQGITRGRCAKLAIKATTNQACAGINIIGNIINNDYLFYYLQIKYEELRNLGLGGVQPNLNSKMIKEFSVMLPPIDLQTQFAEIVKQIDKQKFEIQKSLEEMQTLQESLINKYFNN